MSTKKRIAIIVGSLFALAILWVAYRLHKEGSFHTTAYGRLSRPLIVGLVSWPGYAGGIVANNGFVPADQSTFFEKYGLHVKFVLVEDIDARGKAFAKGGPARSELRNHGYGCVST